LDSCFLGEEHGFFDENDLVGFLVEEVVVTLLLFEALLAVLAVLFAETDRRGIIYKFIF
jgi:hypothetical protein